MSRFTDEINDNGDFRNKRLEEQAVMLGCVVGELARIADSLELITQNLNGNR